MLTGAPGWAARAAQGWSLMHVAVHVFMAKSLLAFHDHLRPFATISGYTAPHGPVRGYGVPLVGWDPCASRCAASRSACAQHSILEQKCKENRGMADLRREDRFALSIDWELELSVPVPRLGQ